jgi:RNA dependent RNA polymerase
VAGKIISDVPLNNYTYNKFTCMMKAQVKPPLVVSGMNSYAGGQSICYCSKPVNSIYCPVMRVVRDRLVSLMDGIFLLNSGMSPDEFARELNEKFSPDMLRRCSKIENDFSKYDKSQGETLLRFEVMLYEKLGMDPLLAKIWYDFHEKSYVADRINGTIARVREKTQLSA